MIDLTYENVQTWVCMYVTSTLVGETDWRVVIITENNRNLIWWAPGSSFRRPHTDRWSVVIDWWSDLSVAPPIASVILQKLQLQGYYWISWWHSTVATWQHWPCWTCLLHSTRSITASYCTVTVDHMASAAVCIVHRRSRAADRRTSSAFPPVCRRYAGVNRLMSACSKPTCHGASTTCGGDVQQQAAAECTEDGVYLVRSCTSSSSHSWSRRPSRSRLCSSGPVSQRPWCVRWWWHDDEGTHQPRAVVVLWYTETAQID